MVSILLTGATGYLGSQLAERLLRKPGAYTVTILKRSFSDDVRIRHLLPHLSVFDIDRVDIADVFRDRSYDMIVHAATNYGRSAESLIDILEANLLLPLRLLEAGISNGVRTFINTDTMLDKRVSEYSLSKRHFRDWLLSQSARVSAVNVSLEHFFGPRDDDSKFVSFIVRSLLREVKELALTEGTQRRDFVYIDDVVEAFMHVIDSCVDASPSFRHYEVGSGSSIPVREFIEAVRAQCGNTTTKLNFGAIPLRANEAMDVRVDTASLRALGWRPGWTLAAGLARTIDVERKSL